VGSIEPATDRTHLDNGLEVECCFSEACCGPLRVFHFVEEPFGDIAHGIAVVNRGSRAKAFGQIALRRPSAQDVENPIEHFAVITSP
jgi:hypothetical protein